MHAAYYPFLFGVLIAGLIGVIIAIRGEDK